MLFLTYLKNSLRRSLEISKVKIIVELFYKRNTTQIKELDLNHSDINGIESIHSYVKYIKDNNQAGTIAHHKDENSENKLDLLPLENDQIMCQEINMNSKKDYKVIRIIVKGGQVTTKVLKSEDGQCKVINA